MSDKLILYGLDQSPPVRAVRMALEALHLDYEFMIVDVHGGELQTPKFLKKNPQHTVPILEDLDGKCISDSHAIMAYLVRKYGKTDELHLYPKDYYQRAIVDQRLHYENGVLFMGLGRYTLGSIIRGSAKKADLPEMFQKVIEAYEMLETFLDNNTFIAGNNLTIADFSVVTTLTALVCVVAVEPTKFPKLSAWFDRMKELPYYDSVNSVGSKMLRELLNNKMKEIQ